jgi:hypothetical protein
MRHLLKDSKRSTQVTPDVSENNEFSKPVRHSERWLRKDKPEQLRNALTVNERWDSSMQRERRSKKWTAKFVTFRKPAIRSGGGGKPCSYHYKLQVLFKIFLPEFNEIQDKITDTLNEVRHPKWDPLNIISSPPKYERENSDGGSENK